jgi:hypothetical protein
MYIILLAITAYSSLDEKKAEHTKEKGRGRKMKKEKKKMKKGKKTLLSFPRIRSQSVKSSLMTVTTNVFSSSSSREPLIDLRIDMRL